MNHTTEDNMDDDDDDMNPIVDVFDNDTEDQNSTNDTNTHNNNKIELFRDRFLELISFTTLQQHQYHHHSRRSEIYQKQQQILKMITTAVMSRGEEGESEEREREDDGEQSQQQQKRHQQLLSSTDNTNNNDNNDLLHSYCNVLVHEFTPKEHVESGNSKHYHHYMPFVYQCIGTIYVHVIVQKVQQQRQHKQDRPPHRDESKAIMESLLIVYCYSLFLQQKHQYDTTTAVVTNDSVSSSHSCIKSSLMHQMQQQIMMVATNRIHGRRRRDDVNEKRDSTLTTTTTTTDLSWMYHSLYQYAVTILTTAATAAAAAVAGSSNVTSNNNSTVQVIPTIIAVGYTLEVQMTLLQQKQQQQDTDLVHVPRRRWIQLLLDYSTTYYPRPYDLMILHTTMTNPGSTYGLLTWKNTVGRGSNTTNDNTDDDDDNHWLQHILPTFLLKLKSHPFDRTLATFYGWIQIIPQQPLLPRSTTTIRTTTKASSLELPLISDEYLQLLLQKHLTHTENEWNRYYASCILCAWAMRSLLSSSSSLLVHENLESTSFTLICSGIISMKPIPTLSGGRIAVYQLLEQLAIGYRDWYRHCYTEQTSSSSPTSSSNASHTDLLDRILSWLCTMIQKDTTKPECRTVGVQAVVEWMIVYKTITTTMSNTGRTADDAMMTSTATKSGYATVLQELICHPIEQNKKLSDTAIPIFSLLIKRTAPEANISITIASAENNGGNNIFESIIADIWLIQSPTKRKAWDKAMETVITSCSSKKTMQTDTIILLYVVVQYYLSSSLNTNVVPTWIQKVVSGGNISKSSSDSFLYSSLMIDGISSNEFISTLFPRIIAQYTKCLSISSKTAPPPGKIKEISSLIFLTSTSKKPTTLANMLALCVMTPFTLHGTSTPNSISSLKTMKQQTRQNYAGIAIVASLDSIMTNTTPIIGSTVCVAIVEALIEHIDLTSRHIEDIADKMNATREARENDTIADPMKQVSKGHAGGFDTGAVRSTTKIIVQQFQNNTLKVAESTSKCRFWSKILILSHVGTSIKRLYGPQRKALISNTVHVIRTILKQYDETELSLSDIYNAFANEIIYFAIHEPKSDETPTATSNNVLSSVSYRSMTLHRAALSLLVSLGRIAVNDEYIEDGVATFCKETCVKHLAPILLSQLEATQKLVCDISIADIDLFRTPIGIILRPEKASVVGIVKASGKRLTEEEEWEQLQKKEIAEKKAGGTPSDSTELTPDDKKLLDQQDSTRLYLSKLIRLNHTRLFDTIRYLCLSDIEIGNECLPILGEAVLSTAAAACPACTFIPQLVSKSIETLIALATGVYEIHEDHARSIASALLVSLRILSRSSNTNGKANGIVSLPSPCPPVVTVISEIESYGDTLTGASFAFLFSIIKACLFGPRISVGCEGALKTLFQHTSLLYGDLLDQNVTKIRKDMATAVLELLKHDRSQTFQDPTALETLAACYYVGETTTDNPTFTVAELSPLLDDRGALGSKNCRIGALFTLSCIAKMSSKALKSNLLVENRIWLNCFDRDVDVRTQARKAWANIQGVDYDTLVADESTMPRPSPLYAPPLLSLLNHMDSSIALAAAEAYARAMAMHSTSVNRNITILCTTYIDSFPKPDTASDADSTKKATPIKSNSKSMTTLAPPTKKTVVGLPKAKAPPKSALAIAGIGQPKTAVKKKTNVTTSVLLKPKQERTLDQAALDSQFKLTTTVEVEKDLDSAEKIAIRKGVLRAISAFSTSSIKVHLDEESLKLLTSFLIAYGIADENVLVQGMARDTLRDVVASNGDSDGAISFLLPLLEAVLKTGTADESTLGTLPANKVPKSILASDRRKEGTVVALGSVALHLQGPENDSKVDSTVDMLISALKTPSEEVQISVAEALTKLMKKGVTQNRIEVLLSNLLKDCLHGETLATRRGAAYGLAAAVKGSGIATLKKYEIVKQLEQACSSGTASSKEGSLFSIELLCSRLGLLFEPYVIVLLPSLLQAFSDNSDHVRAAASHTTGLIMSKLSAHGVKLVMPAVLTAFNDPSWRTKQASIHMLGAMSHLAPKQLAAALPKVVPQLTEAFSDTHPKVKASAQEALNEISTVVKNPEISSICPVLMKALTDPADNTVRALEALIATEFLHAIDAPSLALIAPILHRGLRDRGATTKRASSLIAGNICSMINDPKDFVPYLPTLLPDLQSALLDPIPDVRSTSAHALGSLTRSLGELIFLELRPWLIERLRDENSSSAERSGAAQGLTEVLIASGSAIVETAMRDEILPLRSHPSASTREGVLWMLTFLPPSMGQGFTPLIDISLPALIGGLSDDNEPVRDVAIRAGRVLIRSHGKVHVDKILPSLEAGLTSDDHRIRIASLSLLGDLLSLIGGTQLAKGESDTQDDIRKAERAQAQIALVLGSETRKRVLSGLYMARCDSVHMVRQSAIQVWKTVVSVTVRALRDILPVLVARIIDDLASGHFERTELAGRCLGDVVGKLGDSVLPQIIPVLRKALYDGDEHTKRGVCVGLTEVIKCSSKEQILRFLEIIIPVVRDALSDDSEIVRKMAASSFQSLHNVVGSRVMDEIVPSFMVALEGGERDEASRMRALNGLVGILGVRSRELLPYIIPRLIKRPITVNQAQVLAGIARVTGSTIHFHFGAIIPALVNELSEIDGGNDDKEQALRLCCQAICGSVDPGGVNWLIAEIASKCASDKASVRRESCRLFDCAIVERAEKADFYEQIPIMMREMLYRLNDANESVLKANHSAWTSLSTNVPAEELVRHVEFMRGLIASMVSDARRRKGGVGDGEFLLPGLNMSKGVEPLIPIYQRGILYGSPIIREVSAAGLGELIDYTSSKYLAGPLIVKMTGPLLRIVGDRNPSNVKVAILQTLGRVLVKGGPALRAFVPQFQTTFVKALSDPSRHVRIEAIVALSLLMPLATRVDPLIKELIAGSLGRNATSVDGLAATVVQTATLEALAAVLSQGGSKVKLPDSVPAALDASKQLLGHPDEGIRDGAAKVMGTSCAILGLESTKELVQSDLFNDSTDATVRHGLACAIRRILVSTVSFQLDSTMLDKLKAISLSLVNKDEKSLVREAGFAALGATIGRSSTPRSSMKSVEMELLKVMRDTKESIEIHRAVARCLCVALLVADKSVKRVDFLGVQLLDACLFLSLKGMQRVQYAFYDVLYLALSVSDGNETGVNRYCELTIFDNQRAIKSLYSKVLAKMKEITILER